MWKQCKLWHNSRPCYSLEVPSSDGGIWQSACSMECFLLTATVISYSLKAPANYPSNPSFKLLFAETPVRTVAHSTASVVICPYLILSFLIPFASLTEIKDTRSQYDSWTLFTPNLCCFHFYACKYKLLLELGLKENILAYGRLMQQAQLLYLNPVSQRFFRESTQLNVAGYFTARGGSADQPSEKWKHEKETVTKSSLLYGAECNYPLEWLKPSSR